MYDPHIKQVRDPSCIPDPQGYKILIAMPAVSEMTEGGIIRPDEVRQLEGLASIFGYVVSMGPDCYTDKAKFPTGPWCKVGDWVVFRSYSGTRFKIDDQDFRLINDDSVEAVVESPEKIARG